jgi:hypothetical protein
MKYEDEDNKEERRKKAPRARSPEQPVVVVVVCGVWCACGLVGWAVQKRPGGGVWCLLPMAWLISPPVRPLQPRPRASRSLFSTNFRPPSGARARALAFGREPKPQTKTFPLLAHLSDLVSSDQNAPINLPLACKCAPNIEDASDLVVVTCTCM